eukprot:5349131-Pyramimonas_sp.AAC.2
MTRPGESRARLMWEEVTHRAQNPFDMHSSRLCRASMAYMASGGVYVRHCSTEFRKHVFPRLFSPAPICRVAGQRKVTGPSYKALLSLERCPPLPLLCPPLPLLTIFPPRA